jgi:hypothetical protein
MATQVYRVTQVLTAAGSPVARLQANNEEGHDLRLELPTQLVERTKPGHVLVLNWSLHALPGPLADAAAQPQIAAETAPPASAPPPASAASPRSVDDAFMGLMSRVRPSPNAADAGPPMATTPPASQTRREPDLNDEFNKLLGSTRTKG